MPDILNTVYLPAGKDLADCFLFVFYEDLSVSIYRATVGDIISAAVSVGEASLQEHIDDYGDGGHVPANGMDHADLNDSGSLTHAQLDGIFGDFENYLSYNQYAMSALALYNSWASVGGSYGDVIAGRVGDSVQLSGAVQSGTYSSGVKIASIPVGYRPAAAGAFPVAGGASVVVNASGDILLYGYVSGIVSLSAVVYRRAV